MTAVVSVFVDGPSSVNAVAEHASDILHIELTSVKDEQGDLFRGEFLDLFAINIFNNHGLVNDSGINFEKYNYEIDIIGTGSGSPEQLLLMRVMAMYIRKKFDLPAFGDCIVVDSFQKILTCAVMDI